MPIEQVEGWLSKFLKTTLVTINQTPITPASLIVFTLIVLASVFVTRILTRLLFDRLLRKFGIKEGILYTLRRLTEYTLILVGVIIAFQFVGIDLSGLAVIFGLLSVGIGFGLQNITANFVAGLVLLFERPIKVGDRIMVGDVEGDVEEIGIRSTKIRTLNNVSIIVPNSQFTSSNIVNWSHGDPRVRLDIDVGVSYGSDLDLVLQSLKEVALENPKVLEEPEPDVLLREFGDSSWNMRLRLWIDNPRGHHGIRSDINGAIVRKFREKGIEIPFPQRDLHVRSPLPLPLTKDN
ncbi:MAG TPA: mechanosensitive ion channel family protein [Candidatus Aminicenantes bacterium]|nr:mechanosensitive ion channel family protein [Candidatus Aminicenantes bacterium]